MLRTHTLLNNLHTVMGQTPLVMFYPGSRRDDAQALRQDRPRRQRSKTDEKPTTTEHFDWSIEGDDA